DPRLQILYTTFPVIVVDRVVQKERRNFNRPGPACHRSVGHIRTPGTDAWGDCADRQLVSLQECKIGDQIAGLDGQILPCLFEKCHSPEACLPEVLSLYLLEHPSPREGGADRDTTRCIVGLGSNPSADNHDRLSLFVHIPYPVHVGHGQIILLDSAEECYIPGQLPAERGLRVEGIWVSCGPLLRHEVPHLLRGDTGTIFENQILCFQKKRFHIFRIPERGNCIPHILPPACFLNFTISMKASDRVRIASISDFAYSV